MIMVEPLRDETATDSTLIVLPNMVENPTPPTVMLETNAVDVVSVLPDIVDVINAPADKVEPLKEDRRTVLPVMLENVKMPLYMVEADKVDVANIFPCAVEKINKDVIVFHISI